MDAFDKARALAREKNADGMGALPSSARAIDLVKVLAAKVHLEPYGLDPMDPLLNGALAVLAREDGAIYHVKNVTDQDLALLIGHELAHFHLHVGRNPGVSKIARAPRGDL